jgi:hypothetical protein
MPNDEIERFKDAPALNPADPNLQPAAAAFELNVVSEKHGQRFKVAVRVNPEDVIAFFASLIALLFGVSMIVGWIPINPWTIGVITLSGVTPGLARIAAAQSKKTRVESSPRNIRARRPAVEHSPQSK